MKLLCSGVVMCVLLLGGCADEVPVAGEAPGEVGVAELAAQACGGFGGLECPDGFTCVDDPRDDCDPKRGGADCIGTCKRAPKGPCPSKDRTYVSRDPDRCAVISFFCESGVGFSNHCGCGCWDTCDEDECSGPAPAAPTVECPDGSTAGPECARSDNGQCGWIVTSCP